METILRISIILCVFLLHVGCEKKDETRPNLPQPVRMSNAVTLDNCTYIPINLVGTPQENTGIILNTISQFEKANPNLDIRFWQITYTPPTYMTTHGLTYGIWLYHRGKQ
jgi:hypothetical protein